MTAVAAASAAAAAAVKDAEKSRKLTLQQLKSLRDNQVKRREVSNFKWLRKKINKKKIIYKPHLQLE